MESLPCRSLPRRGQRPLSGSTAVLELADRSVQVPAVGDSLEFVLTSVLEGQAAARGEISDRGGHKDLGSLSAPGHSGRNVYCDAAQARVPHMDLARVQTSADLQPERQDGLDDCLSTANSSRRAIERG